MNNNAVRQPLGLGIRGIILFSFVGLQTACGGGGGSSDSQAPQAVQSVGDTGRAKATAGPTMTATDVTPLQTLRNVVPPDPSGTEDWRPVELTDYVTNRTAAIRLGKALFWDMNVGSDGNTACATCHFKAGADNRITNQINPGQANVNPAIRALFNKPFVVSEVPEDVPSYGMKSGSKGGPNDTLVLADFPLHLLADPTNRDSAILYTTDDVIGSQGVFDARFIEPGQSRFDDCAKRPDGIFHVGGINTRRATDRNSPSVINAVFNVRNFWDGRANNVFNGFSPFGNRDPDAGIWVTSSAGGPVVKARLALQDASAASQAVGPPGSDVEMSCGGRSFSDIARRVLDMPALNRQAIDPTDSILASFSSPRKPKYRELIQAAFQPRLWNSAQPVSLGGVAYSQAEANFPLFFGLAIQLYEATLVSDQTPLDAYLQGNTEALNASEVRGMELFNGKAQCVSCHGGPELTNAATRLRLAPLKRIERMLMGDGQAAVYDNGFYNIGVRPTSEDLGVGRADPWGNPLSFTRQYRTVLKGGAMSDPFTVDVCSFEVLVSTAQVCDSTILPVADFRDAVDGAFKTPGLRNVELTGPYFHNGSRATLEQVLEFYNRGGDRRGSNISNTSRFGPNNSNLDPDIKPLGLTPVEVKDLAAFLKTPLTDPRVAWERAPFDHPSLTLPNGHIGDETKVAGQQTSDAQTLHQAPDVLLRVPAVGAAGRADREGSIKPFHLQLR
ncbi:cytochrome-c peroxidase [Variovorax sp. RHLX14]|uniref:cytochrome-c peroxidase n=1 Tax=Variovorax sp. RHLX14 TaxID=1259731 RepID=UPI003F49318B